MMSASKVVAAAQEQSQSEDQGQEGLGEADLTSSGSLVTVIKTHYERLFRLLYRQLNNRELAQDLTGESIKVTLEHASSGRLNEARLVAGYVFKVAMNLVRNHRRSMGNRADMRASAAALESIAQPEAADVIEGEQNRQLVRDLFAALAPRDREVIRRFYLDDEDRDQICRELGLSQPVFNQVICRARQRLKSVIESRGLTKGDFFCLSVLL